METITGSDTMSKWQIQGSRVYGNGQSYNCTNRVTAEQLQHTLNTYEKTLTLHQNLDKQFDQIQKQLIQLNMTLQILNDEIKTLTGDINDLNSTD